MRLKKRKEKPYMSILGNNYGQFGGFQIIESQSMTETYQFRFPRSKKKRIKKKWQKRPINFKTRPRKDFLLYGDYVICNPIMAAKLRRLSNEPTS